MIVNSDVLIDLRLDEVLRYHREREAVATLVLREDAMADAYGAIWTDVNGTIRQLLQHEALPDGTGTLKEYMFTGVHVVEPLIFQYMDGPEPFSITRTTYPRILAGAERLCGFPFRGEWQDLGTRERLEVTDARLRNGSLRPHFL